MWFSFAILRSRDLILLNFATSESAAAPFTGSGGGMAIMSGEAPVYDNDK